MHDYPEILESFVENLIFEIFNSVRTSKQVEDRYQPLSPIIKGLTTKELRERAQTAAKYLLSNVDSVEELAEIEKNSLLREALQHALSADDQDTE